MTKNFKNMYTKDTINGYVYVENIKLYMACNIGVFNLTMELPPCG